MKLRGSRRRGGELSRIIREIARRKCSRVECRLIGFRVAIYILSRNMGILRLRYSRPHLATIFNDQFQACAGSGLCRLIDTETRHSGSRSKEDRSPRRVRDSDSRATPINWFPRRTDAIRRKNLVDEDSAEFSAEHYVCLVCYRCRVGTHAAIGKRSERTRVRATAIHFIPSDRKIRYVVRLLKCLFACVRECSGIFTYEAFCVIASRCTDSSRTTCWPFDANLISRKTMLL